MKVPDYISRSDSLLDDVSIIEYEAISAWSYAARRIMWRAWKEHATFVPAFFDGFYEGDDEANRVCDEKVGIATDLMFAGKIDIEALWQEIANVSLYESIDNWKNEPGMYGYCLTKEIFRDFEEVVFRMFPTDSFKSCSYKAYEPDYPEYGEDLDPDPDEVFKWAVDLIRESSVTSAFEAYRAGVPLEDIAA